jgi:hypothetical protein
MVSSSSKIQPIGIRLDRCDQRAVLQALAIGRQSGLRAGYQAIEQIAEELALSRAELERVREQYALAQEILRRVDAIDALRERDGGATLH